jgi:peptidoglycan-associated lipoprotein
MYKILSIIPVIFLSSCLFSNNIIVDEEDQRSGSTSSADGKTTIISERKVISRDDKDFLSENINTESDTTNYSLSGLSSSSSKEAREAIAALKQADAEVVFVVYFEFNSSELSPASKQIITYHNNFLQNNPNLKLFLHGHTDIKGSRGYNLSLGEERALSVKNHMQGDINTISFGEEKTISTTDSKNRRVEFIYQ